MPDSVSLKDHVVPKTEDFKVGQSITYSQVIDDKLVRGYADLTGDHNPIHVDDAFAKRTKFHQRIAHGGILFGLVSMVLGDKMPGIGTIYLSQLVNFHAPVFKMPDATRVHPAFCASLRLREVRHVPHDSENSGLF